MATTINYLSLTGLQKYDTSIKEFITNKVTEGDAKSFKYVNLENGVLKFYTVNPITEDTVADFEIELPEQELSHLMQLVDGAVNGNIAVFGENGQVVDSGVAIADLATKEEVEAVDTKVDELATYVGTIPADAESTNIVAYVNEKAREVLESATGGSSESAASVKLALDEYKALNDPKVQANTDAIEVLNGDTTVEGSVDKKVADAINEFATQITDDGTINTFKEVLNYISTHGGEAAEMMSAIDTLETLVGDKAVATQIAEAIANENLDQYATDEELAAAVARIVVLEEKAHEHTNKVVLDGITAEKVAAWDVAETNAKTYVDEQVAAVNNVIGTVVEGKTVVQMIEDAKTSATYDDAEVKADVAENAAAIETLSKTHTDDKAELVAADEAMAADIAALKEIEHLEITEEQIDALFA